MKVKKWFFALNSDSNKVKKYERYIRCAVKSALENTSLEPHFLYDDNKGEIESIGWLEDQNVTIHRVSSRFVNEMERGYESADDIAIARGAFLRVEIPELVKNMYKDEYVLYTDCDVIFLKEFSFSGKCKYFACAPRGI